MKAPSTAGLSDGTRKTLAQVSVATLTSQLFKRGLRNTFIQGIRRVNPEAPQMVGTALTLRFIPAREDIDTLRVFDDPDHPQMKSVEVIAPGQVLVMDCRGNARAGAAGDIMVARATMRGGAGLVTDGGLRDWPVIAKASLPVYGRRPAAPNTIVAHHAVELDVPIACGGVAVYPGDVLVGDAEGVVVIPPHLADEVAADALKQDRYERFVRWEVCQGRSLKGLYPPTDESRARYAAWEAAGAPEA